MKKSRFKKRWPKRAKRPKTPPPTRPGCLHADELVRQIEILCLEVGLGLEVAIPYSTRGRKGLHWMFSYHGIRRILDYWPATGTVKILGDEIRKGPDGVRSPMEAFQLAKQILDDLINNK